MTVADESPERDVKYCDVPELDSDCCSSNEDTRLLLKDKGEKLKYPRSVFFIIGNEFCERFTYYGLRTVLTIYLTKRLYYSDSTGVMIYHFFSMLAYFTPVVGAIIADSFLGKFKTILYLSILYSIGGIVLSIGSYPLAIEAMRAISLTGLFIIAVGTGGIKPCVAAFGGDQFKKGQENQLQQFFSVFYLSINLGSLISTFLTPILREDVHCFGEDTCFLLAFGVPVLLMIVAVVIFVAGKSLYVIKPPEGNMAVKVMNCVCYALRRKSKSSEKKKSHWLDYADDKFDKDLIQDIKTLFHVLVLFIPLPVFWALFDQQGSRWILQATKLDGVVGSYHIKADQMQVVNPLLIIAFIPVFEYCVYPLLTKCNVLTKPLQRMTVGGLLAGASFVVAGLLEVKLEDALPIKPDAGFTHLTIMNNSPCPVKIDEINMTAISEFENVETNIALKENFTWNFSVGNCSVKAAPFYFTFNTTNPTEVMMITLSNGRLRVLKTEENTTKSADGEPRVRLFYNIDKNQNGNVTFLFKKQKDDFKMYLKTGKEELIGITDSIKLPPGKYSIDDSNNKTVYEGRFGSGGVYIIKIYSKADETKQISSEYELVKANFLSILYQIPQYIIITAGEIMFSITGLEFSYSQSPSSMKSVLQASWLMTVAFGNLLVMVISKLHLFEKISSELFLFAALMGIDMIIFAVIAYFYKYVDKKSSEEADIPSSKGKTNEAYVEETDFNK